MSERPLKAEYPAFFAGYVSLVPETDVLPVLESQPSQLQALAGTIPADRETWRYQPEKWSIREVFGHLCDAERVFGYRAFCISRGEQKPWPGFDERDYVAGSVYDQCSLRKLVREFALVREANLLFIRRLDGNAWQLLGTANESSESVRALTFIMAGHVRHHINVLNSRYGI